MRSSCDANHLVPEYHATISEILADRGTEWHRVDSVYLVVRTAAKP